MKVLLNSACEIVIPLVQNQDYSTAKLLLAPVLFLQSKMLT